MAEINGYFKWTKNRSMLAEAIADGRTIREAAKIVGIPERTAYRWNSYPEFIEEVDRLTLMLGIASKAERIRITKRVVREKMRGEIIMTKKDILEWLEFAAKETDEIRLNLADLIGSFLTAERKDDSSISEAGSGGSGAPDTDGNDNSE